MLAALSGGTFYRYHGIAWDSMGVVDRGAVLLAGILVALMLAALYRAFSRPRPQAKNTEATSPPTPVHFESHGSGDSAGGDITKIGMVNADHNRGNILFGSGTIDARDQTIYIGNSFSGNLAERAKLFAGEIVDERERNLFLISPKNTHEYMRYARYAEDSFRWHKHPQNVSELRNEFARFHIIDRALDRILERDTGEVFPTGKSLDEPRIMTFAPIDIKMIAERLVAMAEEIEKAAKQPRTGSGVGEK